MKGAKHVRPIRQRDPSPDIYGVFSLPKAPTVPQHWNIAPSQTVPVIKTTTEGIRKLAMARWGLIPHWAKDPAIGHRLINA